MKKQEKSRNEKEATAAEKRRFEREKSKQVDPGQPSFDPDSDEDTTGKSEAFDKKKVGGSPDRKK